MPRCRPTSLVSIEWRKIKMVELDYNNPEHKTMCEEIILAKRLNRRPYYTVYEQGSFFFEWGRALKFWNRRTYNVSIEKQLIRSEDSYVFRVHTMSGILKVKARVPIQVIEQTGGI